MRPRIAFEASKAYAQAEVDDGNGHDYGSDPDVRARRILESLADLRHPHKWYTTARLLRDHDGAKRKIIFHTGPTNR
jgi:hypothetical protein